MAAGPPETVTATEGGGSSFPRIPLSLQAVFIASNRGKEVTKAPPEKVAQKTYFRNWIFQGWGNNKKKNKSSKKKGGKGEQQLPSLVQFGKNKNNGRVIGPKNKPEKAADKPEQAPSPPKPAVSKSKPAGRPPMSPQAYLDVLIHSRGYSTRRYRTLQTGYYAKPTAFQQASYNVYLVKLVRSNDVNKLRAVLEAGISHNPCNAYGESLVHMISRRGDHKLLEMMLDVGTSIQVSDDYGRTPLHDACWAARPSFETVELIANKDISLFHMTDSRGAVPLSYVRREHWPLWIEFLESKKDAWWPPKTEEDMPSPLIDVAPNERPIPEPENALSIELAGMVASGVMSPQEVALLQEEDDEDDQEESDSEDDVDSDEDDSEVDSDEDSSEYDSDEEDEDDEALAGISAKEMADMLGRMQHAKAQQSQ